MNQFLFCVRSDVGDVTLPLPGTSTEHVSFLDDEDNQQLTIVEGNGKNEEVNPMQKLEDALVECKFGVFHLRLLFATLNATFAATMVTTTSSYILPSAECDLNMNIMQKGLLNAMPFFGQVGASLFTGFLIDAFGRKIFLVCGHIGIFICTVLEGFSQTYWMLIMWKLIEGIFLSISFTASAVMVTEFTHKNVRDRVLLTYSSFLSSSLIVVALISWGLLTRPWHFVIIEGYFELHPWNIYLFISSIWSLMAAVTYYFLPESPKYLQSQGQEDAALEILKTIYKTNTGKPKDTFPISSLRMSDQVSTKKNTFKTQFTNALFDVKELFRNPLFFRLVQFSCSTFVCLLAYSALRLWYPQLSTIIEAYKKENGGPGSFCTMISWYTNKLGANSTVDNIKMNVTDICVPDLSGAETYINGAVMGVISLICVVLIACVVDYFGQKPLMFVLLILCATCSGCLYWTYSSIQIALLVSFTCALMQTALSLQQNVLVRVFPTTVRTLALSLILMAGRIGSLLGNVLFPIMLQIGCMGPFLILSVITLCVAGLVYFLPNPKKENKGTGDK